MTGYPLEFGSKVAKEHPKWGTENGKKKAKSEALKRKKDKVMSDTEYDKKYFGGSSKLRKAYGPRV